MEWSLHELPQSLGDLQLDYTSSSLSTPARNDLVQMKEVREPMTQFPKTFPSNSTRMRSTASILFLLAAAVAAGGFVQSGDGSFQYAVHDLKRPQPAIVTPGPACVSTAPSDAIVLFGGKDISAWKTGDQGAAAGWAVKDGVLTIVPGSGDISTRESFGDCQFHIEWMVPTDLQCKGQHGCNSGLFFHGRYELQILNSSGNTTYADGMAGSLYGQYPPMVNPCRPQGEWNSYDVVFRGPRFDASAGMVRTATMTVLFNGVLVQDDVELLGATAHGARATYSAHPPTGSIKLQDHGDALKFRNIWIRPLGNAQVAE